MKNDFTPLIKPDEILKESEIEFINSENRWVSWLKKHSKKIHKFRKESNPQKMKDVLGDKVQNINISTRIIDSPCCLLTDDNGYSANMQRILKAQALNNNGMLNYMMKQKEMEINPKNKIIKELNEKVKKNKDDPIIANITNLLYDISLLTSGFTIEDPSAFANKFNKMIQLGLSIDDDESDDEEVVEVNTTPDDNEIEEESTMEQVD